MVSITLICTGKLKEQYFIQACGEYQKRLQKTCNLQIEEIPECRLPENPSPRQVKNALLQEGSQIRAKLPAGAWVCALCIEGRQLDSRSFYEKLEDLKTSGRSHFVFLIGGSYGLDETLKQEADFRLSMSPMTFPHHLARVMLLEQLYRCGKIQEGARYHK